MELILIRGVEHAGKTTAAARILKRLVREHNADVHSLILDWYCVPVIADNDKTPDFQAILSVNELSIGIISQGDCACDLKDFLDRMFKVKPNIDILILCARSRYTKGSTYELICQRFGDLVKEDNTYWLNLDDTESKKKEVAYSITERILQEAKVL